MEFRGELGRGVGGGGGWRKIDIEMWMQSSNFKFGIDGKALMHFWVLDEVKIIHYEKLFINYSWLDS